MLQGLLMHSNSLTDIIWILLLTLDLRHRLENLYKTCVLRFTLSFGFFIFLCNVSEWNPLKYETGSMFGNDTDFPYVCL